MQNCCEKTPTEDRQKILSHLASKMVNSGHSLNSSRILIVQGVTKYYDNLRLSKLPQNHKHFRSLYLSTGYKQSERQIQKYMGKMTWFSDGEKEDGRLWRSQLRGIWGRCKTTIEEGERYGIHVSYVGTIFSQ